jgi:membrane complex biogenesis BtpA family protein
LFHEKKPLVAVVHLPPSLGYAACPGLSAACDGLAHDLDTLQAAGFDGVIIENDNDKPHTLTVSKAQVAWLTQLSAFARARVSLPLGIGVQRIDWEATIAIAAATSLELVRLDVFVDEVEMLDQRVVVDPAAVRALRADLGADIALWTDVHVKHAALKSGGSIADSAARAAAEGSDAISVTGDRTGLPPSEADLQAARQAASPTPVVIGSGLRPDLAADLAPLCDGAMVGTAVKDGDRIDPARSKSMVEAWRQACESQP